MPTVGGKKFGYDKAGKAAAAKEAARTGQPMSASGGRGAPPAPPTRGGRPNPFAAGGAGTPPARRRRPMGFGQDKKKSK